MDIIKYLDNHKINWAYIKMLGKKPLCFSNNIKFNGTFKLSSVNKKFKNVHDKVKTQEEYINLLNESKKFPTQYIIYDTRIINCVDIDSKEYNVDFLKERCSYIESLTKKLPHFFCKIDTIKNNTPVQKIDMLKGQGAYVLRSTKVHVNKLDTIENINYKECCKIANILEKKPIIKKIIQKKNNIKPIIKKEINIIENSDLISLLNCLDHKRFENFKDWLIIGSFIKCNVKNEDDKLMIFKLFSGFSKTHKMSMDECKKKLDDLPTSNPVPLEVLLSWARFDNPELYKNIIMNSNIEDISMSQYELVKKEFEQKHFYILESSCFGHEINKKKTIFKMNSQFKDDVGIYDFEKKLKNGKIKEIDFFKKWKKDKSKRMYEKIDWIPDEKFNNPNIYNTFSGFKLNDNYNFYDEEAVNIFIDHLKLLTNNEDKCWQYLLHYIAHIFQYPQILPAVSVLIKSYEEGVGKDKLIDIIGAMLGDEYITRISDMKMVTGNNNSSLKNKLIVQLNEVSGKDGYESKNVIKDLITREKNIINEKYIKITEYSNYTRLFIFSNNVNPININHNDRRFIVFNVEKKESNSYYKKLHNLLNDKNKLKSILFYLKNKVDLSKFDIRNDRPKTSAYTDMADYNTPMIYEYLFETYEHIKKIVKINTSTLLQDYNSFVTLRNSNHNLSSRQLKTKLIMTNLIKYKRNSKMRYFEFDSEILINYLVEKYYFKKIDICIDSDDESDIESEIDDNISQSYI